MLSHTDIVNGETISEILKQEGEPAITIVLNTSRTETQQAPIQLGNAIKQIETELSNSGIKLDSIQNELDELKRLLKVPPFWSFQGESLVIYLAPNYLKMFRLPMHERELTVVSQSFYLRPLFKMVQGNGLYYLLTLSRKSSALYACTRDTISQLYYESLPTMEDWKELIDVERQLQFHTDAPLATGSGSNPRRAAMFFGHGGESEKEVEKKITRDYFRLLDRAICQIFSGQKAPLVLAGVEYLLPIYREISGYPNILGNGVHGNFEHGDEQRLHQESWLIASPIFSETLRTLLYRYRETVDRELIVETLHPLLPAAKFGAVDTLIISEDASAWAHYDERAIDLEIAKEPVYGFDELYDLAARSTYQKGGTVVIVPRHELPAARPAVALLRFPVQSSYHSSQLPGAWRV